MSLWLVALVLVTADPSVCEDGYERVLRRMMTEAKSLSTGLVQERVIVDPATVAVTPDGAAGEVVSMVAFAVPASEAFPKLSSAKTL